MLNIRIFLYYFIFILLIFSIVSCRKTEDTDKILATAEKIVTQYPDSALLLLDSISNLHRLHNKELNRFRLLQIQAKDKAYKDITEDTVIFRVREYYKEENNVENLALASFYCGRVLQEQRKWDLAMAEYMRTDTYAEATGNINLRGLSQSHIGEVFSSQLLQPQAIKHFEIAVQHFRQAQNIKNEIISYNQIGNAYLMSTINDRALYYYNRGLKLAKENNDSLRTAWLLQSIGIAYRETGKYNLAEKYFKDASEYAKNNADEIKQYLNLSKIYYKKELIDSAKIYINKSLALLQDDTDIFVSTDIYKTLSEISEKQSDLKQSLEYFKKYTGNIVKITGENKRKEILELHEKYQNERLQNENNKLKAKSLQRHLFVFTAVLALCLITLFFYLKSVQGKREILKKGNELLEKDNELLEANARIYQLLEMAESYNHHVDSDRNLLLHHFDILKRVSQLKQYLREDDEPSQRLVKKFNDIVYGQESINWNMLYLDMNKIHNGLFNRLKEQYPVLDENEFRICCMAYADFTCSETGIIMKLSVHTVEMKRSSIRKKLGIEPKGNIRASLDTLLNL